jgi:hypothetical protein
VIHVLNPRELRIVPGNLCNRCGHSIFFVTSKVFAWGSKSLAVALLSFRSLKIARGSTSSAKGYKSTSPGAKSVSVGRLTRKDKGLHKVVFMSGVLPEGTDVGYYVGGKVTFLLFVSQLTVFSQCKCYFVINTCSDNFLEVTRSIYKGTWDLLSLLQHSG